jgi:hypothetical protein
VDDNGPGKSARLADPGEIFRSDCRISVVECRSHGRRTKRADLGAAGIGESIDFWIPESREVRRDSGDLDVRGDPTVALRAE